MKKNLGSTLALYPTPVVVIGAIVDGKPTWTLAAHTGTVAHSHQLVSLLQSHYINKGIKENKKFSINVVDQDWLKEADLMGTISGNNEDKSEAFSYTIGENGVPLIDDAKVSIECEVDRDFEVDRFDNFVGKILATYADEEILNEKDKIDYDKFKPVLFEFPTYQYYITGETVGNCRKLN